MMRSRRAGEPFIELVWLCLSAVLSVVLGAGCAARPPPPSPPQPTAKPGADVYALQPFAKFDTLDGAMWEPRTRALTLFGHRARQGHPIRVAFLDHLAAALKAQRPTFSLPWPESTSQQVRNTRVAFDIVDGSGQLNEFGAFLLREGGVDVKPGSSPSAVMKLLSAAGGAQSIFKDRGPIDVPAPIVRAIYPFVPMVKPRVVGFSPRSLLAQIVLEADVQGKYLEEMPELKGKIQGYSTWPEWERTNGSIAEPVVTTLVPGKFEIAESADGNVMRFGRTPVTYRKRKVVNGQEVSDPILTGYADMLTARYDELAAQFPILHQLRECLKVVAVAEWIARRGLRIDLPEDGRIDWEPPEAIPGVVFMTLTVENMSTPNRLNLNIKSTQGVAGGVDLRVGETSEVTVRDLEHLPVISPVEQLNDDLRRIMRAPLPAPPLPDTISGWESHLPGSKKGIGYLTVRVDALSNCVDSLAAREQLERVQRTASQYEYFQKLIEAETAADGAARLAAQAIEAEAADRQAEYKRQWLDDIRAMALDVAALRLAMGSPVGRRHAVETLEAAEKLDKVGAWAQDGLTLWEKREQEGPWSAAEALHAFLSVSKREDVAAGIDFVETLMKDGPRSWMYASKVASGLSLVFDIGFTLNDMRYASAYLLDEWPKVGGINQMLGDHASLQQRLQQRRVEVLREYEHERGKLELMLKPCDRAGVP